MGQPYPQLHEDIAQEPKGTSFMATGFHTDTATTGLTAMRAELDQIDARLLAAVRDRLDICVRIAEHKRAYAVPMMQPQRIGVVHDRAAKFGAEHGVDEDFLHHLYDLLIAEACRVEDLVIGAEPAR